MKPIKTKSTNVTFGEGQDEYQPLPAFRNSVGDVVTCWELSDEEVSQIIESRRIFLFQKTFNQHLQPVSLHTENPVINYSPLKQTRLHTDKQRGNCFPTALACLMQLGSPEEALQIQEHYQQDDWVELLDKWLAAKGYELQQLDGHIAGDELYLVTGESPRDKNIFHICIYKNCKLEHDPHPDGTGIKTELRFEKLVKIK